MNNRFEVRKGRLTPIVVAHDDWLWPEELVAVDLSPRGLFVARDRVLPPGESVRLCFRLGTPEFWQFEARVVYARWQRRTADPRHTGMGLELLDASPLERIEIRSLLRAVPPPLPLACRARIGDGDQAGRRRPGRRGGRRADDPPWLRTGWRTLAKDSGRLTPGPRLSMVNSA